MRTSWKWLSLVLTGLTCGALSAESQVDDEAQGELPRIVSAQALRNASSSLSWYESENDFIALASSETSVAYPVSSMPPSNGDSIQLASHSRHRFNAATPNGQSGCELSSCSTSACNPCSPPWWAHANGGFGEVLYLTPGNSDLIYAAEQTDTTTTASPTGPLGITNVDGSVGFRVGFSKCNSQCSSFFGTYARWDGDTTDTLTTSNRVLKSRLIHPSTATVGSQSLRSTADQLINFQIADFGYRRILRTTNCSAVNWLGGLRYGNLEQGLTGRQIVQTATGLTTVKTDIDFDGFGILLGLDGERRSQSCGGLIYGKTLGSLLAGNWKADYTQTNQFGGGVIANSFQDYRVTPVIDAELGLGWVSRSGCLKLTAGYLFNSWFNTVSTRDYVRNVRSGNFEDLTDVLTFSGLTSRLEFRF